MHDRHMIIPPVTSLYIQNQRYLYILYYIFIYIFYQFFQYIIINVFEISEKLLKIAKGQFNLPNIPFAINITSVNIFLCFMCNFLRKQQTANHLQNRDMARRSKPFSRTNLKIKRINDQSPRLFPQFWDPYCF